jgi:hypothetical protein
MFSVTDRTRMKKIMVGNKWICDEDKFSEYLLKRSEQFKS